MQTRSIRGTVHWDGWRAVLSGPAGGAGGTFMLLVAITEFQAGNAGKGLLAAGGSLGFLLTPVVVWVVAGRGLPPAQVAAWLVSGSGLGLLLAGLATTYSWFLAWALGGMGLAAAAVPLITGFWQANVPAARRGHWYAGVARTEALGGALCGLLVAGWMHWHPGGWRPVMVVAGLGLILAGVCVARIPRPGPLQGALGRNPFAALAWLWRDRRFGWINLSWTLMGMANLATVPLRADWLSQPDYGIEMEPARILLLLVALPTAVRLLLLPHWGRWFDRLDFVRVRMLINACFAAAMALMFTPYLLTQILGAIAFGIAVAGADLAWNLWVTKIAPPGRTADYMGVHVFLSGLRGISAPLLGFALVGGLGPPAIAWGGIVLVVLATAMLVPEMRQTEPRGR